MIANFRTLHTTAVKTAKLPHNFFIKWQKASHHTQVGVDKTHQTNAIKHKVYMTQTHTHKGTGDRIQLHVVKMKQMFQPSCKTTDTKPSVQTFIKHTRQTSAFLSFLSKVYLEDVH